MPHAVTRRVVLRGLASAPFAAAGAGAMEPRAAEPPGPTGDGGAGDGDRSPQGPVFECDLAASPHPLHHPWRRCVGSCHAPLALRADWQRQLARAHRELEFEHVRFHGLLSDDMGTLVEQDGRLLDSFFNIDRVFDFLRETGMRPFIELSFMPTALASGGETVFRYRGNITPPRHVSQWTEFIARLAGHWCERYGVDEVARWPIEVWNEPNLPYFWTSSQARYFQLFRATRAALKKVSPRLQVGGPVTAANGWLEEFDAFCKDEGCPPDFISTHYYPTDAFGKEQTDTVSQLAAAPMSVLRDRALEARRVADARPLCYTEWNITSNPHDAMHDGAFCAALATRLALSVDDVADVMSWWTFTDVFEENYFPSVPYHGGFGLFNLYGVPKPVYRGFQLLAQLGARAWDVRGGHPTVAVAVGEAADGASSVLLTNVAMPRHAIASETATVWLDEAGVTRPDRAVVLRIDDAHANPRAAWEAMGRPEYLSPRQVEALEAASALVEETLPLAHATGPDGRPRTRLTLELPANAMALVRLHRPEHA
jgi:xylan 1,4-beta-xylosidase